MAVKSRSLIALGDHVAIIPLDESLALEKPKIAMVTYVGPVYIRLSDGSAYSTIGLESLRGNDGTRIERVADR
jgi:hypothetical protein